MPVSEPRAVATGSCQTAFALTTIHLLEVTLYDPVATARGSDTKLQAKAR